MPWGKQYSEEMVLEPVRGLIEPAVAIVGLVLIIVAGIALVTNLVVDVLKLFKDSEARKQSLGSWLEKLPERYFIPTVLLLLGILLADPELFSIYSDALFPGDSGGADGAS